MNKLIHVDYSKKGWSIVAGNIYQTVVINLNSVLRSPGPTTTDKLFNYHNNP